MKKTLFVFAFLCTFNLVNAQETKAIKSANESEEKLPEIFEKFTWLQKMVDHENCNEVKIQEYQTTNRHYQYVIIDDKKGKKMYTTEGSLHCTNHVNADCIKHYKLEPINKSWSCK